MEESRDQRVHYRAKHIPIEDLFCKEELEDLENQFSVAANEEHFITFIYLNAILQQMNFQKTEEEIESHLKSLNPNADLECIDFENFSRLIAILLEELNNPNRQVEYLDEQIPEFDEE